MNKKQEIRYHIIFWVLFLLMEVFSDIVFKNAIENPNEYLLHNLEFLVLQMGIFYLVYLKIAPVTIPAKKWTYLVSALILCILLFAGLRYVLEEIVLFKITGFHNYYPNSLRPLFYIFDNSYYAFRIILLSLVFYFVKHQLKVNQQYNELKLEKKQAELQVLKSQLSPHFLFNTLNSFYADALDVNSKLSDDILKLSEMLRYVTYQNEEFVLLKDELNFLNNYIILFKRRFEGGLYIKNSYPEFTKPYKVPTLLLIHFVENAFKHGVLNDAKNPIQLHIEIVKEQLVFKIENAFKPQDNYDENGIGYKNITQRLQLMFGKNYQLKHFQKENKYFVELQLPLKK